MTEKEVFAVLDAHDRKVRNDQLDKILEYVKTDEFYAQWVNARDYRFGEFLAMLFEKEFRGR